jgi:hypothetical protein
MERWFDTYTPLTLDASLPSVISRNSPRNIRSPLLAGALRKITQQQDHQGRASFQLKKKSLNKILRCLIKDKTSPVKERGFFR